MSAPSTSEPDVRTLWTTTMPTESGLRFARILAPHERDIVKPVLRECWWNAMRAARLLTSAKHSHLLFGKPVLYVEGLCVMRKYGIPFEHGWLRIGDEIVEATSDSLHQAYFAAREWPVQDARAAYKRARYLMPLHLSHKPTLKDDARRMAGCYALAIAHVFGVDAVKALRLGGSL